ncbi:hypothetical protein E2C01_028304 [Portunus trituberculatus]|uniref:Uncharacterized protein n=1 Tax=Portunus trituberculatus TaxID=210409 RepID=A0A5B7EKA3_PORTR|nr:hypothetical protein [Portunus trituberculatus]
MAVDRLTLKRRGEHGGHDLSCSSCLAVHQLPIIQCPASCPGLCALLVLRPQCLALCSAGD